MKIKRIIEIDEEEYKLRKVWAESDNLCSPDTLMIAQSKPYDDSGDCISRSAVTKQLEEMANDEWNIKVGADKGLECAIDVIENAQAVEARPKGEWTYGEDDCGQDGWFCSECGFFVPWYYQYYEKDINFIRDYKVCPHCKAEMITYTGKDRDTKGGDPDEKTS